jgi:hypothetical protein
MRDFAQKPEWIHSRFTLPKLETLPWEVHAQIALEMASLSKVE